MLWLAVASGASGCCCFGDFSLPEPRHRATEADDPAITRAAREYLEQHAQELLEPAAARQDPDGGRSGSCRAAILAIGATVLVPVITRGHAGSETAAYAWFDVRECLARVRIVLQWVAATGLWIVIGADTLIGDDTVATLGTPVHVAPDFDDYDLGSDEFF